MCRWRCTGWSLDDFLASWKYGKLPLVLMEKPFTTWWKKTSLFHRSANNFPTASQFWQFTHIPTTPTTAAIHPFLSNPKKILWKSFSNWGTVCTPVQIIWLKRKSGSTADRTNRKAALPFCVTESVWNQAFFSCASKQTDTWEIIKAPFENTNTGNYSAFFAPLSSQILDRLEL